MSVLDKMLSLSRRSIHTGLSELSSHVCLINLTRIRSKLAQKAPNWLDSDSDSLGPESIQSQRLDSPDRQDEDVQTRRARPPVKNSRCVSIF